MKYCFLLLLMLPVLCFAQKHSAFSQNNIPNAANMIEIKGVARNEVTNALLDKGFQISDNDGPLNVIITEPKEAKKNSAVLVTLYLYINDSSVVLTGMCKMEGANDNYIYPASNKGSPVGIYKTGFNFINQFALSLNKPISYIVGE